MSDKDKPDRKSPPAVPPTRDRSPPSPGDRTVFRSDAVARAGTVKPKDAAAAADATRVRAGPPSTGDSAVDPTRVKPAGTRPKGDATMIRAPASLAGQAALANAPSVDQHRVLKGRFTLEKVIGVGGMGVVYKATDRLKVEARDREPYVAIKVLSEEFKAHPESFVALQRESRKTQRLAHPNVVKVFDFDRDREGDLVFMTMEYLEGRPLDQIIAQYSATGLPANDAWAIMDGLCSALIHAHAENIVHSDFKPGNIFITDAGVPKIFDFGIARAVASVDRQASGTRDVTVFDAGSLGALTPAYASLEMLMGKEPDVRDDIYALGCIAYEMLTGRHPFDRLPADEAQKRRLRPKRITSIKRRQWKAIEQALAFKREDRVGSVAEFYQAIAGKARPPMLWAAAVLVVLAIAVATYFIITSRPTPERQAEIELSEIEFGIRYNVFKEKIEKLLAEPTFTEAWEDALWEEMSGMKTLLAGRKDAWYTSTRRQIYDLYVKTYQDTLARKDYARAVVLLDNAYRYATDTDFLDAEKARLAEWRRQEEQRRLEEEQRRKAALEEKSRAAEARQAQTVDQKTRAGIFDLALRNVNQQLSCDNNLNMRDLGVAIDKLRSVDRARYNGLEPQFVTALANCIVNIGRTQPERAQEAKKSALRIFPNNALLAGIQIVARDACNVSLAGLGARNDAAVCRDRLQGLGAGPALVVVPATATLPAFAIGKYEVSIKEINQFCRASGSCQPVSGDDGVPATKISVQTATEYTRWLSRTTGQKYRLPTRAEWMHAAKANSQALDPNRNCAFSTRGIEKGGQLVRVNVGVQNAWGLVNTLGNSQEWAYDQNRELVAVGGSFEDGMQGCRVESVTAHSGGADDKTGFRIVRELGQ